MDNPKSPAGRFRDPDLYIACLALAVLIVITVGGVAMRYIVNRPLGWIEEMQLWCLVWVVFLGGSAVARHSGHIAVDAFIGLFPMALRRLAGSITQIVIMAVLGFFAYYAWRHVVQMFNTGRATNILEVPYYLIYGVVPLSCLLMFLTALYRLLRPNRRLSSVEAAIEEVENV